MQYLYAGVSDKGIVKEINQDSMLTIEANASGCPVLLSAVCDGMGGLKQGEVASFKMVRALEEWFEEDLPFMITEENAEDRKNKILFSLYRICNKASQEISEYGAENGIRCGTTVTALLLLGDTYITMNVGDSRVYLLRNRLFQLTHDQTVVQKRIDEGLMTPEEAETDSERSKLTQCIGAGRIVHPEYRTGEVLKNDLFLLCSDGLRHKVKEPEIERALLKENPVSTPELFDVSKFLVDLNKERKETDNITCVLARAF